MLEFNEQYFYVKCPSIAFGHLQARIEHAKIKILKEFFLVIVVCSLRGPSFRFLRLFDIALYKPLTQKEGSRVQLMIARIALGDARKYCSVIAYIYTHK